MTRVERIAAFRRLLSERIRVLDGVTGTMIQSYNSSETDCCGTRFRAWPSDVKGSNDSLTLAHPRLICDVYPSHLTTGATDRDQVEEYARRKILPLVVAKRSRAPNSGYQRGRADDPAAIRQASAALVAA